jgi:serine/threonine-protein kinase
LFHHAAELGLAERSAFLDRVCADDEVLRREVESLLASDLTGDSLIEAAVRQSAERLPADSRENYELIGKRIGPYSMTRLIGKGGMGAVYRAIREDDFRMEVAIKVLKHGTVTEAALSRFRAERQILAGLQHPNIARLLDGGATETGLPYFAME